MGKLDDGFRTLVRFEDFPSVEFFEVGTTPPGISGGGPIDTTTMRNVEWRTASPKKISSILEAGISISYDPAFEEQALAMVGVVQNIEVVFPDGERWEFEGWLESFAPQESREGDRPLANIVILNSGFSLGFDSPDPFDVAVEGFQFSHAEDGLGPDEIENIFSDYQERVIGDDGDIGNLSFTLDLYNGLFGSSRKGEFFFEVRNVGVEDIDDDIPVKLRRDDTDGLLLDTLIEGGLKQGLSRFFTVPWNYQEEAEGVIFFTAFHEFPDDNEDNDSSTIQVGVPREAEVPGVEPDPPVEVLFEWSFIHEGFMLYDSNDQAQDDLSERGPYTLDSPPVTGTPWSFVGENELGLRLVFDDDAVCHVGAPWADAQIHGYAPPGQHSGNFTPPTQMGGDFGPSQIGHAVLVLRATENKIIRFDFDGIGERRDPLNPNDWSPGELYEEMRLFVEEFPAETDPETLPSPSTGDLPASGEEWIGWARAPGGGEVMFDPSHPDYQKKPCELGMGQIVTHPDENLYPKQWQLEEGKIYRFRVLCSTRDAWYHFGAFYQFEVEFENL